VPGPTFRRQSTLILGYHSRSVVRVGRENSTRLEPCASLANEGSARQVHRERLTGLRGQRGKLAARCSPLTSLDAFEGSINAQR
jgi:hypothetical protein